MTVQVKGDSGTVIAEGQFDKGRYLQDRCEFPLSLPDVPSSANYSIVVGPFGEVTYTAEELDVLDWTIQLSNNGADGRDWPVHRITGAFTVLEYGCSSISGSGYSDIPGLQLRVRDEDGTILANGDVSREGEPSTSGGCRFNLSIEEVPKTAIYSIESGRRGELAFDYEELSDNNWQVQLSVGQ